MIATAYALKQLVTAGVRVFFYLEDRERTLDSATDKVLMAVNAYAGELEREMARQRSRDAARQRATKGYVTGGRCYGYQNVRAESGGHVSREIVPEEVAVVRAVFRLCAEGKGAQWIARALNAEGAPTPRAERGRPNGWVPSSVYAVLRREIYRGVLVLGEGPEAQFLGPGEVRASTRERMDAGRRAETRDRVGGRMASRTRTDVDQPHKLPAPHGREVVGEATVWR